MNMFNVREVTENISIQKQLEVSLPRKYVGLANVVGKKINPF